MIIVLLPPNPMQIIKVRIVVKLLAQNPGRGVVQPNSRSLVSLLATNSGRGLQLR